MCQFNLVFVKNSKNKKILENNEYKYWNYDFNDFSSFVSGLCDCNSFVGSMSEYTGNSYFEMIETINNSELDNLLKIKDLMSKPDYKKQKEKYIAKREKLSNAIGKFFEPIFNYKTEQINIIESKYNGKALKKQMNLLYKNLDKKFKEIKNSDKYKSASKELHNFIEKNQLMEDSTLYYLTKEDEYNDKESEEILLDDDLFENLEDLDNEIKYIDIPEESFLIDTVIQKLENKYTNNYDVFLEYKNLFETLLENEDYILFSCIFNEPGEMSIQKEVNIKDIKIEDLASLEYDQIIKIYK